MNRAQKEVQQTHLDAEKKTIRELQQVYKQARRDCEQKIRELSARTDMENLQTIVYQKQYQEALKKQLDGIIDSLQSNEFTTIADYLQTCYQNGYVGVMYDLQSQGIPIITPINQEQVTKALQTDSKISKGLYNRLGEDTTHLKKSIRAELSRGVANGSSWNEIAVKIAKGMNSPYNKAINNALRIARTEGHRVQQQSALDGQHAAKDKGADIVKQWDATLDSRTRPEHREADGQIREVDEPFDVGGEKLDAPGIGGSARNVVNCRCCSLQRAKWALDEDELKTLQERAAYYGLDKTKDFEEFKQKYLKAATETDTLGAGIADKFDRKSKLYSAEEDAKAVNPNYNKGGGYRTNCGYCSVAYEMRRRGYDVEANPLNCLSVDDWTKMFDGAKRYPFVKNQKESTLETLTKQIKQIHPDNARGSVFVQWKNGGSIGHFFSWELKNGNVIFTDAQNGKTDVSEYFKNVKPASIMHVRWDNLHPSDAVEKACKNRGAEQ